MKRMTGLYSLGLLLTAVALTVSCGDDGGDSNNTGGTSAGGSSAGNSSAGTNTAGTNTAGTNNPSGGSNNPTGGTNNNPQGGDGPGPDPDGGDGPGPGPQGGGPNIGGDCAPGVEDGEDCEQGDGICELDNGDTCVCFGFGGNDPQWTCGNAGGDGGAGPGGGGDVTCPADAEGGEDCTGGPGICPGQQCFCNNQDEVMCF